MKKRMGLRILVYVFVSVLIGSAVYSWNAKKLVGENMPMPFGIGMAVVLSGSMEPTFSKGDLIVVRQTDDYVEDDIVVFQDGRILVVHRIIEKDGDVVVTQGDANNVSDGPISTSDIKGKVLFWIPFAGNVVQALQTPLGIILTLIAAIVLVELPNRKQKQKDDEERQKIVEEIIRLKKEMEE